MHSLYGKAAWSGSYWQEPETKLLRLDSNLGKVT